MIKDAIWFYVESLMLGWCVDFYYFCTRFICFTIYMEIMIYIHKHIRAVGLEYYLHVECCLYTESQKCSN